MKKLAITIIIILMTVNIQICFAEEEYPYVDKITMDEYKEKYEKERYVGNYYFRAGNENPYVTEEGDAYPYGGDFEASADGETWFNLNISTDSQPSIFYGNGKYVIYDWGQDVIPVNKLYEGLRRNYPLYILDEQLNVINKWDAEGYKRCIGFIDGYFYFSLHYEKDRGNVYYFKTADGINLIDISDSDEFLQAFKKRLYTGRRLYTGMLFDIVDDNIVLTTKNGVKYSVAEEIRNGLQIAHGDDVCALRSREYDSNSNVIENKISLDGLNYYDMPLNLGNLHTKRNYIFANVGPSRDEMYRIDVSQLTNNITVIYNDKILSFATPPVIEDDRTLVPMRFLFEQMGAEVNWDAPTRTALVNKGEDEISFSIDNPVAKVNSAEKNMDVPARLINEKTMIPLRFLSEELGYTVEWDENAKIVTISEP